MRSRLRDLWAEGKCACSGWLAVASPFVAEVMADAGLDCLVVDLQHGMIDDGDAINMLTAISTRPKVTPIARVRKADSDKIGFLLDAGAVGIICPMINNAQEVRDFVAACRYPPKGNRSFGPGRAFFLTEDYLSTANSGVVSMAMIETTQALENLHSILQVDGLDAIFIGPSDLALALGRPPSADPQDTVVVETISRVLRTTHEYGKKAGIFCKDGRVARRFADMGFDFVIAGCDLDYVIQGSRREAANFRGDSKVAAGGSTGSGGGGGRGHGGSMAD